MELGSIKAPFSALRIEIPGTQNFRDLGGYTGLDGRQVRTGLLYRSDQLSALTAEGIELLQKREVRTVIDLRSDPERLRAPNCDIGAETVCCNPSAETAELSASFAVSADGNEDQVLVEALCAKEILPDARAGILTQYRDFATAPKSIAAFSKVMEIVAATESSPLVFHCRGGKDRTGFAAALILGGLGVSEEDILEEYAKTRINRMARTEEKLARYALYTDRQDVLDYLAALLDADPAFLQTSLEEIRRRDGSIPSYLVNTLGLTEGQLAGMRTRYLTE